MSPKAKKILNVIVDVVCAIILAFVLIIAISSISSKQKGYGEYTEIFGKAYLGVKTDSMKGDKEDSFDAGDLIVIRIISADEAKALKVGDVITFNTDQIVNGQYVLNTHRIVKINGEEGNATSYVTRGDHNIADDNYAVTVSQVVGIFEGKAGGIGNVMLFMSSFWGFFTFVVVPSLLVVVYFGVNLVLVVVKEKKVQTAAAAEEKEKELAEEKERMRQELMAEFAAQGKIGSPAEEPAPIETASEPAPTEPEPVAEAHVEEKAEEPEVEPVAETPVEEKAEEVTETAEKEEAPVAEADEKLAEKKTAAKSAASKPKTASTAKKSTSAAKSTAAKSGTAKSTASKPKTATAKKPAAKKSDAPENKE